MATILTDAAYIEAMAAQLDGSTMPELIEHRKRLDGIALKLKAMTTTHKEAVPLPHPQASKIIQFVSDATQGVWYRWSNAGDWIQAKAPKDTHIPPFYIEAEYYVGHEAPQKPEALTKNRHAPLPQAGPICYASAMDVLQYNPAPQVGTHLPGVRDVGLWSTDQLRAYGDARAQAAADGVRAELEADALRYRWLSQSDWYVGPACFYCSEGGDLYDYDNRNGFTLDSDIDAARAAGEQ